MDGLSIAEQASTNGTGGSQGAAHTAASSAAGAKHHKLVDAAQQFEAVFLNEMLKSSFNGEGSDSEESSGPNGTMKSLGTEAVSKAIAAAGGLGIARHIVDSVEGEQSKHEAAKNLQTTLKFVQD
ncbi:MAG: hypothetical protein PW792_07220 [Acidobacteriaceae bacterium]|nr:hypothetical protein [Acidobacteriaceae bacterium]